MKKKIFSLILSICLIFLGFSSLTGCSVARENTQKVNSAVVLKVGDTELTRADVISAFYTYYQNNNSYFAYYDGETIEESFYTWLIVRTLVEEKSDDMIYDAETNPTGIMYYTEDDANEVWKNVEDYFYSQVSTYEKSIYSSKGWLEANYPQWIKTEEDEEESDGSHQRHRWHRYQDRYGC